MSRARVGERAAAVATNQPWSSEFIILLPSPCGRGADHVSWPGRTIGGFSMERWTPTQDEMKSRIARFKDVVPTKNRHTQQLGIPAEVLEMITAKTTRN